MLPNAWINLVPSFTRALLAKIVLIRKRLFADTEKLPNHTDDVPCPPFKDELWWRGRYWTHSGGLSTLYLPSCLSLFLLFSLFFRSFHSFFLSLFLSFFFGEGRWAPSTPVSPAQSTTWNDKEKQIRTTASRGPWATDAQVPSTVMYGRPHRVGMTAATTTTT